jgi:hypothetical protein
MRRLSSGTPIVHDELQDVDVATGHSRKEIAANEITAVENVLEHRSGTFDDMGQIEQHPAQTRARLEHGSQQRAVTATNVDHCPFVG